jgi:hypothetical protein
MTRYLVTHRVKRIYASQDELVSDWSGLRRRTQAEAQWLGSWWAPGASRLYCEWEAVSPQAIRSCFLPVELDMAPIEHIDEVVALDPAWLDEAGGVENASASGPSPSAAGS